MTNETQVHIVDSNGNILFTRLFDDGSNVLCFESGFGHVTQDTVRRNNWELREGWLTAKPTSVRP